MTTHRKHLPLESPWAETLVVYPGFGLPVQGVSPGENWDDAECHGQLTSSRSSGGVLPGLSRDELVRRRGGPAAG